MINHSWEKKFPLHEREANWANAWSKWASKSRSEVIEMTNHLTPMSELEQKLKFLRKTRGWYLGYRGCK